MGNILIKDQLTTLIDPGAPETFPIPGQPGYPGFPAWDEQREYFTFEVIGSTPNPYYNPAYPDGRVIGVYPGTIIPILNLRSNPIFIGRVRHVEVIRHPAIPAVPAIPGQLGTPARLPRYDINYQLGWNGGAVGTGSIIASGMYQFSINPNNIGIFTGFGPVTSNHDYDRIRYALRFDADQYYVYENGVPVVAAPAYFVASDVFTIRRLGPEVAYYKNSTLIHRSTLESQDTLYLSAVMYSAGDQIVDASITAVVDAAHADSPGGLAIALPAPTVLLYDGDGILQVVVPAPTVTLYDATYASLLAGEGTLEITLPAPTFRLMGSDFAGLKITVPAPVFSGQGGLVLPSFGILQIMAPAPELRMYEGFVSKWTVAAPAPKVLLYDGTGILQIQVPEPRFFAMDEAGFNLVNVSGLMGRASIDAAVLPEYFSPGIRASGIMGTARMYGGGRIRASGIMGTAAVTATASGYGTIVAEGLMGTASVVAVAGSVATIVAKGLVGSAVMQSGGRIVASGLMGTALMTGQSGTVGAIVASGIIGTAAITGYAGAVATITASGILGVATSGSYIQAAGLVGRALIIANEASYEVTDAFVTTLTNEAKPVTRYTNYPFHSIVRRGDDYIGFGPNGAFELTGADDDGTEIEWTFSFGPTVELPGNEVGQGVLKRNEGTYWTGRFTGEVTLSVTVDDGPTYTYAKSSPTGVMNGLRIVPGRGLRGFAWQFGLSGTGPADLHRTEFLQRSLTRKVKYG